MNTPYTVTGSTDLIAMVGSPVRQTRSPRNFNLWFRQHAVDLAMVALGVAPDHVEHCVALMRGWNNLRGCVVTVPHKQAFARRVDALTPRARALGAVNVVRREPGGRLIGMMPAVEPAASVGGGSDRLNPLIRSRKASCEGIH